MVFKDYIVYISYDYDTQTNIIELDDKLLHLIKDIPYWEDFFFFSQLESKRFLKLEVRTPFIYKLVKVLKTPYCINSIMNVIDLNNIYNYMDKDFFYAIDTDMIVNCPNYKSVANAISNSITTEQNYCEYQNSFEYKTDGNNITQTEVTQYQNPDTYKIIRIYGPNYQDTLELNQLHIDDLSIVLSINLFGMR